jgi:hypothetical protein
MTIVLEPPPPSREALRVWLVEQAGKPYLWCGKGERRMVDGAGLVACFDCSGLVTVGLVAAGYPPICTRLGCDARGRTLVGYHSAQRLWNDLEPTGLPFALDLAFYGRNERHVEHVMFVWGDGRVYGSCGGNSSTTDPSEALRRGQGVKFRPHPKYRPDLVGFRRTPF